MSKVEFACATALALLVAAPAFSQEAPQQADEVASEDSGEIFVTATLRTENLQEVPIAVTAFSAASLDKAGVRDIRALDQVSASFNLNSSQTESGGTTLRVRGVGTTGNNTGLESAVGIFLDGVYLSRPGIALGDLLDVTQVELLRGPQGTLFGRNTSAGALNIKTAKPNLNKFEGFANATYGNYDLFNIQGGVSAPLVEGVLGLRLSGAYRNQDGFQKSVVPGVTSNDRDRYILRGQLYFEPNADLNVRIIADYQKSDEKCCDAVIIQDTSLVAAGAFMANGLPANGGVSASGRPALKSRTTNGQQFLDRIKQYGISGEINYSLGNANVVSITGYRDSRASSQQESDFVSLNVFSTGKGSTANPMTSKSLTRIRTFSQEFRISGDTLGDRLQYLFGAYYNRERINERATLTLGPDYQKYISANLFPFIGNALGPNPALTLAQGVSAAGNFANNADTQNSRNFSFFTNNTFKITDAVAFNFGLRYSNDRKRGKGFQISANSPACAAVLDPKNPFFQPNAPTAGLFPLVAALTCFPFSTANNLPGAGTPANPIVPAPFDKVYKNDQLVYTGKLTFKASENINTYLSYTRGYKAGGFNLDPSAAAGGADPRFKPEIVRAYEAGIKSKLLDNRVTANLAVFHQDLKNFQVLEFTGVQFQTFNVGKARATGVELEVAAKVADPLSLNLAYTYTDARYPKNCGRGATSTVILSLCGNQLTNAPKNVVIAGFDFDRDIGAALNFTFNGSIRYESDRRTSTQAVLVSGPTVLTTKNPFDIQESNTKINLRAGIGSQDGIWRIEVFGNNITDRTTRNVTFNVPLRGGAFIPGPLGANGAGIARGAFLQEPRTYGVTVKTKF